MARPVQPPQVRIIDNKKVLMTQDEYFLYEEICKAYDRPNFAGKDLFQDHFETNSSGIIIMVKPPHKKYSSMEVFTFLVSLQVNQHLRVAQDQQISLVKETEENLKKIVDKFNDLEKDFKAMKEEVEAFRKSSLKVDSKEGRKPQ